MHAHHSVSVACRPAETHRQRGEIGSVHRSILMCRIRHTGPERVRYRWMGSDESNVRGCNDKKVNGGESKGESFWFYCRLQVFIRVQFSAHCYSSLSWRLCLENLGKVCLWNCFMLMILFWLQKKTWRECVKDDMKLLGLQPEWAIFRDMWRDFIWANI